MIETYLGSNFNDFLAEEGILDRLLDPQNESATLQTLERAAIALGKRLHIELGCMLLKAFTLQNT